jgi:hypothetical protein
MTEKKKPLTITLRFRWDTCTPDPRQYNQQRQVLNPDYLIEIDIPLTRYYVKNTADILVAQTSSDLNVPAPILTPNGMFLAISMLEEPFRFEPDKAEVERSVDEALDNSNVDWGDEKETEDTETWNDSIETDENVQTQFEPEETVVEDEDKAPDWEDEKSWD